MQQRQEYEIEQKEHPGFTPEEYREVVRRAQAIRRDRDSRLSHGALAESAAEVGIREEDLREAEQQLREERLQREKRRATTRLAAIGAAVVLALVLMFTYNGLNSQRLAAVEARSNLQSTLQRRADLIPQLVRAAREGAANERELVQELTEARQGLLSNDVQRQLEANARLNRLLVESTPQFRSTELYQDLMAQMEGTENRINVARQRYNQAATGYNRAAQSFPANVIRPIFGLPGEMPYYEPPRNVEAVPEF